MKVRQIGAYGVLRGEAGVLHVPGPDGPVLPGALVALGEHPAETVLRAMRDKIGSTVRITGVNGVSADLADGGRTHTDRILFGVDGALDGPVTWLDDIVLPPETPVPAGPRQGQRFGAYAHATDRAGRILLTRIAAGYPGAGRWHLPGGGTDHGERPEEGLARELTEETSQTGRIVGLAGVSHRYDPAAIGPEGVPLRWHVVRVLFRVLVDRPTEPVVTEAAGGSTDVAGWFTTVEAGRLPLTEVARDVVTEPPLS